ncbi:MAG TPA: DUF11 domain-containing protein, partial [Actinomycetota bacterium]|nr:DUF11 domain-containing protein [Actinomycetota bacterium]
MAGTLIALAPPPPSSAATLGVQVAATTVPVANFAASQTTSTATCPAGDVLVGGGAYEFFNATPVSGTYEPINGLVIKGTVPSDAAGNTTTASSPSSWTAYGGFAGQSELNDADTAFAMCLTGGPSATIVQASSINGPNVASTTAPVTASCPAGTQLLGGGAEGYPPGSPSFKPVGSYPSDAAGDVPTNGSASPNSWTAVGESGGGLNGGLGTNVTTAFAICGTSVTLQTQVAVTAIADHPAGPGNGNPGSDAVATATASCPAGTTLLDGGALAMGDAAGLDSGPIQQGVHLRGSYPSDASANPVSGGASDPNSWSSIVQSGGQATPGTDTYAFALCAQPTSAPASADLSIGALAAPSPATAGSPLTYTLTVGNAGPSTATAAQVTDTLASGVTFSSASASQGSCGQASGTVTCSLGDLASGGSATVTIVVTPPSAGSLSNVATVGSSTPDPTPANNSVTTTTTANTPAASADLSIGASAAPSPATAGNPVTYTVTVGNDGPSSATGVQVTDTLDSGVTFSSASASQGSCGQASGVVTCSLGGLVSGGSATVTIVVTPQSAGSISNVATVGSTTSDPNPANNSATTTTTVSAAAASADLSVTATASPDPATAGSPVTYTVAVANAGPSTATAVHLTDTLPAGTTFGSAAAAQGTCTVSTGVLTCAIGSVSDGATVPVVLVLTPAAAGTLANSMTVAGNETDPNEANNAVTVTIPVTATSSGPITFSGTVTNVISGAPVVGICVYLYTTAGARTADPGICTSAAGTYTATVANPGSYDVAFFDPAGHYVTQWYSGRSSQPSATPLTLTAGEAATGINAAMTELTTISGTVTNKATGSPVAGICVYLYSTAGSRTTDTGTCTDAAG